MVLVAMKDHDILHQLSFTFKCNIAKNKCFRFEFWVNLAAPFLAFQKMTDSCLGGKGGEGTIALTKDLKLPNTPKFAFVCFSLCSSFNFKMTNCAIIVHCQNASNFFSFSDLPLRQKWASGWRVFGYCPDYINTLFLLPLPNDNLLSTKCLNDYKKKSLMPIFLFIKSTHIIPVLPI